MDDPKPLAPIQRYDARSYCTEPDEGKFVLYADHLAAMEAARPQWLPIATAPRDKLSIFWVRYKTPEESWLDSSGNPIVVQGKPFIHVGNYATWPSCCVGVLWHPYPAPPKDAA